MVTRRKPAQRREPLIHSIVPLREIGRVAEGLDSPERRQDTTELTVTDFTSADQVERFKKQLKGTFDGLARGGSDHAVLKAYPGDIPVEAAPGLAEEFDFIYEGVDSKGVGYVGYCRVFDSERYGRVIGFFNGVGLQATGSIMSAFKGNLHGIQSFIGERKEPGMLLNVREVGGDGDPFRVVRRTPCKPPRKCICDPAERRERVVRLSEGYLLKPKGGSGLLQITGGRMDTIRELYSGGNVSDEVAVDRFINVIFGSSSSQS
jgi:hypothetical protein